MNRKKKGWEGGCPAGTDWGAFKTNTSRDTKTVFSPKGTTSPLSPPGGGRKTKWYLAWWLQVAPSLK